MYNFSNLFRLVNNLEAISKVNISKSLIYSLYYLAAFPCYQLLGCQDSKFNLSNFIPSDMEL